VTTSKWGCPKCGHVQLAPKRPRRNDLRRYCVPCSVQTQRLVERVNPSRQKKAAHAKEMAKLRRRKRYRWGPKSPLEYYLIGGRLGSLHIEGRAVRVRTTKGPGPVLLSPSHVTLRKGPWADKFDGQAQEIVAAAMIRAEIRSHKHGVTARVYMRDYVRAKLGVRPQLESLAKASAEVASLLRSRAAVHLIASGHE
jgi:hypothetical protein